MIENREVHAPAGKTGSRHERVLVVDDEPGICRTIIAALASENFKGTEAHSFTEAWDRLKEQPFELLLADIRMQGGSGMELLRAVSTAYPDMAVVMVTAISDRHLAIQALHDGAYGYLTKPFSLNELLIHVINALHRRELEIQSRMRRDELEAIVREKTQDVRRSHEEIALRLIAAQAVRHDETGAHVRRIGLYAEAMGTVMNLSADRCETLRLAAPMHDVGKIGIPDAILLKPGPLTPKERAIMQTHTHIGARILDDSNLPLLTVARNIALCHHERWDGSGYPNSLKGTSISLEARILAILDVYDALVHPRVYRAAIPEPITLDMIRQENGRHFDPDVLGAFFEALPQLQEIRNRVPETPGATHMVPTPS